MVESISGPFETVRHEADRCLAVRFAHAGCRACAEICPVEAITVERGGWRLGEGCLACGRCVAACPTDALSPPEPPRLEVDPGGRGPVVVDCSRVPAAVLPEDAIRVPCTGGLRVSDWLATARAAGDRPVEVMDRGWCSACPAGGDTHPAGAALEAAQGLAGRAPALVARPLPEERAVAPRPRRPLSRRALFARLAPEPAPAPRKGPRPARLEPAERLRRLAMVEAPPAAFFPAIAIDERCRNHRICAGICPTAALLAVEDEGSQGVVFDPSRCIACGACARTCPEQAIRLLPEGAATPRRLTRHAVRPCIDCGQRFAARAGERRCQACARSHDLAREGFRLSRRPPPPSGDSDEASA